MTRRTGTTRVTPSTGDKRVIQRGDMLLKQVYDGRTRTWRTTYQERVEAMADRFDETRQSS